MGSSESEEQRQFTERQGGTEAVSDDLARADLIAQIWMAIFAGLQLVLTFGALIYIRWTLIETRKAVAEAASATDAARDAVAETSRIGEAQVRAYLSVVGAKYAEVPPDGTPELHLSLNNSGSTPAVSISYFCGCTVSGFGEAREFLCPNAVPFLVSMPPVPGTETRQDRAMCFALSANRESYRIALTKFDEHSPLKMAPVLIIWGVLFYEDVFGATYRSNFAFLAEPRGWPRELNLSVTHTPQTSFRRIKDRNNYVSPAKDD